MIRIPDWLNPWRANRELRSEIARLLAQNHLLDHALRQSNERYDRIRDANAELRSALALYREGAGISRDTSGDASEAVARLSYCDGPLRFNTSDRYTFDWGEEDK